MNLRWAKYFYQGWAGRIPFKDGPNLKYGRFSMSEDMRLSQTAKISAMHAGHCGTARGNALHGTFSPCWPDDQNLWREKAFGFPSMAIWKCHHPLHFGPLAGVLTLASVGGHILLPGLTWQKKINAFVVVKISYFPSSATDSHWILLLKTSKRKRHVHCILKKLNLVFFKEGGRSGWFWQPRGGAIGKADH